MSLPDLLGCLASDHCAHAVHGCVTADIGDIVAAVAFCQLCQLIKIHIICDLDLLQDHSHLTRFRLNHALLALEFAVIQVSLFHPWKARVSEYE